MHYAKCWTGGDKEHARPALMALQRARHKQRDTQLIDTEFASRAAREGPDPTSAAGLVT